MKSEPAVAVAGYSGTPLAKKLGLRPGNTVSLVDAPREWHDWVAPLPPGLTFAARPGPAVHLVHAFCTERAALARQLVAWRKSLSDEVTVWISWPKKSAHKIIASDITEDVIREVALPLGYVDVKVCAVSEIWSGLKLVVRKELRAAARGPAKGPR
jgi:hypothetical protein